jgi:hypothetical protein
MTMTSFLFAREVIIGIAVLGGIASIAAMIVRSRAGTDTVWTVRINRLAYVLMGISAVLFIIRGLTPTHAG